MPYLKSSRITGLSPKPLDVTGFSQADNVNLDGIYSQHEVLLADAYTVTGDVTISDNLILAKLSDDGNAITITGGSTTQTIAGSGSLEGSTFAQTPNASLTGMTGAIGSAVTGTLGGSVIGGSGLDAVDFSTAGIWRLIGTTVASNSATLDQTGLDSSSYDMYAILFSDLIPASDGQEVRLRMGDSSGIDSGGSDYDFHVSNLFDSSTSYGAQASSAASYIKLNPNIGNAAGEGFSGMLYLSSPATSTVPPMVYGTHFGIINSGVSQGGPIFGRRVAAIDLDRIQVYFGSGNVTSGRMSVYGISHA